MEEQRAAGCAERQVTKLVEDHQIATNQPLGNLSGFSLGLFLLERVDELDGGIKASLLPMMLDSVNRYSRCNVSLAGSWSADQNDVFGFFRELATMQLAHECFVDLAGGKVKPC